MKCPRCATPLIEGSDKRPSLCHREAGGEEMVHISDRCADLLKEQIERDKVHGARAKQIIADGEARIAELQAQLDEALRWDDEVKDEWTQEIESAHPMQSGSHEIYAVAMRMVGNRRSKGALVALVNWLLFERAAADSARDTWMELHRKLVDDTAAAIACAIERLSGNRPRSGNEANALSGLRAVLGHVALADAERERDEINRMKQDWRVSYKVANARAERVRAAAEVLAEFVRTAPGRLPERVTIALTLLAEAADTSETKEGS